MPDRTDQVTSAHRHGGLIKFYRAVLLHKEGHAKNGVFLTWTNDEGLRCGYVPHSAVQFHYTIEWQGEPVSQGPVRVCIWVH